MVITGHPLKMALGETDEGVMDGFPLFLAIMALLRILLEAFRFDFEGLPVQKRFGKGFHRMGLYLSVGYLLIFIHEYPE